MLTLEKYRIVPLEEFIVESKYHDFHIPINKKIAYQVVLSIEAFLKKKKQKNVLMRRVDLQFINMFLGVCTPFLRLIVVNLIHHYCTKEGYYILSGHSKWLKLLPAKMVEYINADPEVTAVYYPKWFTTDIQFYLPYLLKFGYLPWGE